MALFEIQPRRTLNGTGGVAVAENETVRVCGPLLKLKNAIGTLERGKNIHFVTAGSWALHDLVKYLLTQTGPADLLAFTWSLTIPAAVTLIRQQEAGNLRNMSFIVDAKMSIWSAAALSILTKHCDRIVRTANHAKGFLLSNAEWRVSVISSANFSNNPRIEGGCISTNPVVFDMHREWIEQLLHDGDPFRAETEPLPVQAAAGPDKTLFLIRGLPGSGKSTLAHMLTDTVFENDDFFTVGGNYLFSARELPRAAATCYNNVRDAMEEGRPRIAVANVFAEAAGMDRYIQLAGAMGYAVVSLIVENRSARENIHSVTPAAIDGMKRRFEVKLC